MYSTPKRNLFEQVGKYHIFSVFSQNGIIFIRPSRCAFLNWGETFAHNQQCTVGCVQMFISVEKDGYSSSQIYQGVEGWILEDNLQLQMLFCSLLNDLPQILVMGHEVMRFEDKRLSEFQSQTCSQPRSWGCPAAAPLCLYWKSIHNPPPHLSWGVCVRFSNLIANHQSGQQN